jgi:hypothetical protein
LHARDGRVTISASYMKTRSLAAALLLSMAPALTPQIAWAQGATDESTTNMARARFKEGVAFYDKGEFEQARASFLQAYALKKHPAVLLNLAWSCVKSGHALEAARYFKQFLAEGEHITDKQRADANDGLKQARAKLAEVDVSAPQGAEVTVDGEHIGMAPLSEPVLVEAGSHAIRVRSPDGATDQQTVTVLAGEKTTARFAHAAASPTPAPSPAPAPTPAAAPTAPAAAAPAPTPQPAKAQPAPAEQPTALPNVPPNETPKSILPVWPALLGYGLMVPTVVGALYVGLKSVSDARTNANVTGANILAAGGSCGINGMTSPRFANACQQWNDDLNLVNTDKGVTYGLIAASGVFFVASTTWLVVAVAHNSQAEQGVPASTTGLVVVPAVGPTTLGATVVGAF